MIILIGSNAKAEHAPVGHMYDSLLLKKPSTASNSHRFHPQQSSNYKANLIRCPISFSEVRSFSKKKEEGSQVASRGVVKIFDDDVILG